MSRWFRRRQYRDLSEVIGKNMLIPQYRVPSVDLWQILIRVDPYV